MITTTNDSGKLIESILSCDNRECQKILYKWGNQNYALPDDRTAYFAHAVKTRFWFNNYVPTKEMATALRTSVVFSEGKQAAGFIYNSDIQPKMLDFCSQECARFWLSFNFEYGLMLHGKPSPGHKTFFGDRPERFTTFVITDFQTVTRFPESKTTPTIIRDQEFRICEENFTVMNATGLRPGKTHPARGISMYTAFLKCPMVRGSGLFDMQLCNQAIQIGVDIVPSVWICPKCHGIIIIDDPAAHAKHVKADRRKEIETPRGRITLNFYTNNNFEWGNGAFFDWRMGQNDAGLYIFAACHDDKEFGASYDNIFVTKFFIDLTHVEIIFGHLIF